MAEYGAVLLFLLFSSGVVALFIALSSILGPKRPQRPKAGVFECGEAPFHAPPQHFMVHFYLVAILFIIFDVELVFLFPWAVIFRRLGWFGLAEMGFFLVMLIVGFVYAWRKKALEWEQ